MKYADIQKLRDAGLVPDEQRRNISGVFLIAFGTYLEEKRRKLMRQIKTAWANSKRNHEIALAFSVFTETQTNSRKENLGPGIVAADVRRRKRMAKTFSASLLRRHTKNAF